MLSLFDIKRMMHPAEEAEPVDDFRILDSWAEYDDNPKKAPDEQSLRYLCYYLETMDPRTGRRVKYYKAICLLRVIRIPESAKQSTAFMNMQGEVLSTAYENEYNLITIIANMRDPALGLMFLYGTQATANTIEEAKIKARDSFIGYYTALTGAFRVLEMRRITAEEAEWLRTKMYNMDYMTVVRGIPKAVHSAEDAGNKGMGGNNLNPDSEGTLEKIIAGMSDFEYVIEVISTPVFMDTLMGWKMRSQEQMTLWNGQLQGTKSLSANISLPMMYMANASQSQGWSKGFTDNTTVSTSVGESFTNTQGQSVGESLSQTIGQTIGQTRGASISNSFSQGLTHTQGLTQTEGLTYTQGTSLTEGFSDTRGVSLTDGVSSNIGQSITDGVSQNSGTSFGQSLGLSQNVSEGTSHGMSYNEGINQSVSQNSSLSQGMNTSQSHGISQGSSYNLSQGQSAGLSHSLGHSQSHRIQPVGECVAVAFLFEFRI